VASASKEQINFQASETEVIRELSGRKKKKNKLKITVLQADKNF
jgi:hypothetical protein